MRGRTAAATKISKRMSERPRRSRQRTRATKPTFPLVPILLAVSFIGFVIGASFAFYQRTFGAPQPVATPSLPPAITPSPASQSSAGTTPRPSPIATPTPPATSSPRPTASPSPSPSSSASPSPSPLASPASPPPSPPASDDADTDFARLAAVVVRQYLGAIERGDDAAAYAAFGAPPGASGATLLEKRYVDGTTRIVRVSSTGTDDTATVDVDFETGGTTYFAQYYLTRTASGAAVIARHTIAKP